MPQAEYERFMKYEDRSQSMENSRNARIRMEDPFLREPQTNTVFSHIKDAEVAKYIIGVSYLEKSVLDHDWRVGIQPDLSCLRIFMKEMLIDIAEPKLEYTEIAR